MNNKKLNIKNLDELIYAMLTESTGTHFLDSGGDDDRHWQRNIKKSLDDFKSDKKVDYDIYFNDDGKANLNDISITISLYHYLNDVLELDNICNKFNSKFKVMSDFESDWNYISTDAETYLINQGFIKQGDKVNTYNYDNNLSQNVLFTHLKLNDDDYYLVSVHNGADVRGGYTDAKLFKANSWTEFPFYSFNIYGTINGINVSNTYNGYSLTIDDENNNDDLDSDNFILNESDNNIIELEYYL